MRELLVHIEHSGELNKYWKAVDKKNDEARRAAKRDERDRRRIEQGSEYVTSDGEAMEEKEDKERRRAELA